MWWRFGPDRPPPPRSCADVVVAAATGGIQAGVSEGAQPSHSGTPHGEGVGRQTPTARTRRRTPWERNRSCTDPHTSGRSGPRRCASSRPTRVRSPRRVGWSTPSSPASSWPQAGSAATPRWRTCPRADGFTSAARSRRSSRLRSGRPTTPTAPLDPTVSRSLEPVDDSQRWRGIDLDERAHTVARPPRGRAGPGTDRSGLGRRPVCGRGRRDARRGRPGQPRRRHRHGGTGRLRRVGDPCSSTAPTTRRPSSPSPPDWPWSPRPPPRVARTARPAWSPRTASPRRRGRSPPSPGPGRESSGSRSAPFPPVSSLPRAPSVTWAAGPTMPRWSRLARDLER